MAPYSAKNVDLSSEVFWPPLVGLGRIPEPERRRLQERAEREQEVQQPHSEAEFRVWDKDDEGRTVVGPWVRPGAPYSPTERPWIRPGSPEELS